MNLRLTRLLAAWAAATLLSACALAQGAYPDRPIKMVVPYAPAGITDAMGRAIAEGLSRELKQPVVVDNKPGASATIGTALVTKAPADGYTLLLSSNANLVLTPLMSKKLSYDVKRELKVVSIVGEVPTVIVTNPHVPVTTLRGFGDWVKTQGNKVSYASLGQGNVLYLTTRMLESTLGIGMTEIPYKGAAPMITALLANDVQLVVDVLPSSLAFIQSGKLHALAVPAQKRLAILPQVPTMAEAGLPPFHAASWLGVSVPAGTPHEVVNTLRAAINKISQEPRFREVFQKQGLTLLPPMTNADVESFLQADRERWAPLIQRYNVSMD